MPVLAEALCNSATASSFIMNEGKTEIQLGPSYDNVHSYKELIHWCLEYLSYTFNNTDVDALKVTVHMIVSSSLQKGSFTVHHSSQMSWFTLSFCRILVFQ